jgi:hypothetical protein
MFSTSELVTRFGSPVDAGIVTDGTAGGVARGAVDLSGSKRDVFSTIESDARPKWAAWRCMASSCDDATVALSGAGEHADTWAIVHSCDRHPHSLI